jgi:hypothetical protein
VTDLDWSTDNSLLLSAAGKGGLALYLVSTGALVWHVHLKLFRVNLRFCEYISISRYSLLVVCLRLGSYMGGCARKRARACVCVCVCARARVCACDTQGVATCDV